MLFHVRLALPLKGSAVIQSSAGFCFCSPQVLETIFSFLTAHEVLLAAPVCRTWRAVAHSPVLWGHRLGSRAANACNLSRGGEKCSPRFNSAGTEGTGASSAAADPGLESLGPAISLPTACLALHERNFLFNPCFKKTGGIFEAMFHPGGWVRIDHRLSRASTYGWTCTDNARIPLHRRCNASPAMVSNGRARRRVARV